MEECGLMVRPPLTSREENFMFVDTLPSPYYDMLIVNTFVKFGDLIYYIGRIEDDIKRGKIVDTEAITFGKKGNVPNIHVNERNRRKFEATEECQKPLSFMHSMCSGAPN